MTGVVVTFYSYKGGVGRSFALVNAATLLARWGYRVLCVDWDLEAPGLDSYFRPHLSSAPGDGGLVDLFTDFAAGREVDPDEHVINVPLGDLRGRLDLLPAGAGPDYVRKVQRLDWAAMYADQDLGAALEGWRASWMDAYDFVLVDSRTGITDIGGICTAQMPDILVAMFTASQQSLGGVLDVVRRAEEARDKLPYDRPRLRVLPVPSRFDGRDEYKQAKAWQARFATELAPLVEPWISRSAPIETVLGHVTVPYVSYWSFGEEIAALTEQEPLPGDVMYALRSLAALLAHRLDRTAMLTENRDGYLAEAVERAVRPAEGRPALDFLIAALPALAEARDAVVAGLRQRGLTAAAAPESAGPARYSLALIEESMARDRGWPVPGWPEEGSPVDGLLVGLTVADDQHVLRDLGRWGRVDRPPMVAGIPVDILDFDPDKFGQRLVFIVPVPAEIPADLVGRIALMAAIIGAVGDWRAALSRSALPECLDTAERLGALWLEGDTPARAGQVFRTTLKQLKGLDRSPLVLRTRARLERGLIVAAERAGDRTAALEWRELLAETCQALAELLPASVTASIELGEALTGLAQAAADQGRTELAGEKFGAAVGLWRELAVTRSWDAEIGSRLAHALSRWSAFHAGEGDFDTALSLAREGVNVRGEFATDPRRRRELAEALVDLGDLGLEMGSFSDARDAFQRAAAILAELPPGAGRLRGLTIVDRKLGELAELLDDGGADTFYKQLIDAAARWVLADPHDPAARLAQADGYRRRAALTPGSAGLPLLVAAIDVLNEASADFPDHLAITLALIDLDWRAGVTLADMDQITVARRQLEAALDLGDPDAPGMPRARSRVHLALGDLSLRENDLDGARRSFRQASHLLSREPDDALADTVKRRLAEVERRSRET